MTTTIAEKADLFLVDASRNVLRAKAIGRFRDRTRAARHMARPEFRPARRTLINTAVDDLYRVLRHTEGVE